MLSRGGDGLPLIATLRGRACGFFRSGLGSLVGVVGAAIAVDPVTGLRARFDPPGVI